MTLTHLRLDTRWATRALTVAFGMALLMGLLATGNALAAPSPSPTGAGTGAGAGEVVPGKLLLMLDASGSMLEADPSGLTRMEAAKKGLTAVVNGLPANAQVGLRVYGATVQGGTPTPEACADTQLVSPIKALDKAGLTAAINAFQAKGETPIAHSLEKAIEDLGPTGKRNIVLVSDGEESCVPDPCPVIKELLGNGIDLQIDTVGYAVGDKARQQLQCIADAGHGTYYDAANADQIATSLTKLSQRAMRPFKVSGTPVKGTHDAATAPELAAGQYTDTITEGEDAAHQLNYRIKRTVPGSTLHVSTVAVPKVVADVLKTEAWGLKLAEPKGQSCGLDASGQSSFTSLMALGITSDADRKACVDADNLTLTVTRRYGAADPAPAPFEIRVIEEPPVTNLAELPGPADRKAPAEPAVETDGQASVVVGGSALSDALPVTPGTYVEQLVPGETTFYRVPATFGQRVRVTVIGIDKSFPWDSYRETWFAVGADILSPTGQSAELTSGTAGFNSPETSKPQSTWTPEIRFQNREDNHLRAASLAGTYTIALSIGRDGHGMKAVEGLPIPVRFAIAVEGSEQGKPAYAAPVPATDAPSPSAAPTASTSTSTKAATKDAAPSASSSSPLPLIGGGLLALALLGGIGYAVWRRRAAGSPSTATSSHDEPTPRL